MREQIGLIISESLQSAQQEYRMFASHSNSLPDSGMARAQIEGDPVSARRGLLKHLQQGTSVSGSLGVGHVIFAQSRRPHPAWATGLGYAPRERPLTAYHPNLGLASSQRIHHGLGENQHPFLFAQDGEAWAEHPGRNRNT